MPRCARPMALVILLPLLSAGCADYQRRSDLVSDHAGEALAANRAMQVIDPWPREGFDTSLRTDASRTEAALRRYRTPETPSTPPVRAGSIVISPQN